MADEGRDLAWIDQSVSGEVLEWRPHLLSREMKHLGFAHLAFEPVPLSTDEARHRLLAATVGPDGIRWLWGGFTRLRLELCMDHGFPLFSDQPVSWLSTPRTELRWADLPPCDALELTPFDAAGSAGATLRVSRPPGEPWIPFRFRYVAERKPAVRLTPRSGIPVERLDRLERLEGVALQQEGHDRFRRVRQVTLDRSGGLVPVPDGFAGLVAVVGIASGRRRLLDCVDVYELDERGRPAPDSAEWAAARRETGSCGAIDQAWPARTQRLLDAIFQAATEVGISSRQVMVQNIRGLHRLLALRACRLAVAPEALTDVVDLAREASLDDLLRRLAPQLFPLLGRSTDSDVRLWLTAHAGHPHLEAVADWAGVLEQRALARACELIGHRLTLQQLAARVRPDCNEGREIDALLEEIEPYPRTGWRPSDLDGRLESLQRRIEESRKEPPIDRRKHAEWLERNRKSQSWRTGVEAALTFCERGEWPTGSAPELPDLAVLLRRARNLGLPAETPEAASGSDGDRLAARVEEARRHRDWEPSSRERDEILSRLSATVLPNAARWSALHRLLFQAREEARRWPALAGELGLAGAPADLGEEARRALLLIELIEGSQQAARSYAADLQVDAVELREVLATPKHPALGSVYQECRNLTARLGDDAALPPVPPLVPAAPTREAFRDWWQTVADLYALRAALRLRADDLETHLEFARTSILPLAQEYMRHLSSLPESESSAAGRELLEALRDFEVAGRDVPTRVYHRLLETWRRLEKAV
ncbi:MAG TPA: hypothetical protein VMW27_24885 [Thermoanaerobaculia bacterium]|nr:hypothetical protein [Thermoanaerobaculia bacterium]